jgi:uncharacterized membrane protein YphA (DoxX/SURF4 family)
MALLAGAAEFFGGLALVFGLLVRPAAAALAFAMLVAIFAVHISKGFFMSNNGCWPNDLNGSSRRYDFGFKCGTGAALESRSA